MHIIIIINIIIISSGNLIYSSARDGTVKFWDLLSGNTYINTYITHLFNDKLFWLSLIYLYTYVCMYMWLCMCVGLCVQTLLPNKSHNIRDTFSSSGTNLSGHAEVRDTVTLTIYYWFSRIVACIYITEVFYIYILI
jgi:WD40 repeat protein